MSDPAADHITRRAQRRVALKLGWMVHAAVFVVVNLGLLLVNSLQGGLRWHLWPLGGWGFGLAIHGLVVLFLLRGEGLHRRMVEREAERLRSGR
ncbi:MAG: 2TM domain-containing protein [Rubrivivax sp.]|jgi:hypothetical protein|nr:2TM domain-containing protein [Rubrivivax sp.]